MKPVLLTLDDDPQVLLAIERDLRQHYGKRFRVLRAESGIKALAIHLYPILDDLLDDWWASFKPPFEGIRVIGLRWSPRSYEVKYFLARNGVPYQWLDIESEEARQLVSFIDSTRNSESSDSDSSIATKSVGSDNISNRVKSNNNNKNNIASTESRSSSSNSSASSSTSLNLPLVIFPDGSYMELKIMLDANQEPLVKSNSITLQSLYTCFTFVSARVCMVL
jgi:hypothetical protein